MLSNEQIKMAIKSKIICLTKHEMENSNIDSESAYRQVVSTELAELIRDKSTDLYLEPIEFIFEAYDIEKNLSKEKMIEYIKHV